MAISVDWLPVTSEVANPDVCGGTEKIRSYKVTFEPMGRLPKIDIKLLGEYLKKGMSRKEIAKKFDVTEKSITRAKKKLREQVTKVTVMEAAPIVVKKELDTIDALNTINAQTNAVLGTALAELNNKTKTGIDPRYIALRAISEIRQQIGLQLEIFKSLYDLEAAKEFQEEVLRAIGEVEPDVRDRIMQRLKQNRAIRAAIQPSGCCQKQGTG
ncbi:helix-turn-helix domain-containing protein [Thermodesulfobacteriota bacterium]